MSANLNERLLRPLLMASIFISSALLGPAHATFVRPTPFKNYEIGCLVSKNRNSVLGCAQAQLSYKVLKRLAISKHDKRDKLNTSIFGRARYFLSRNQFDYFSILSLMVFPVTNSQKWFDEFEKVKGSNKRIIEVARLRSQGKRSPLCSFRGKGRKHKKELYEICKIKVRR